MCSRSQNLFPKQPQTLEGDTCVPDRRIYFLNNHRHQRAPHVFQIVEYISSTTIYTLEGDTCVPDRRICFLNNHRHQRVTHVFQIVESISSTTIDTRGRHMCSRSQNLFPQQKVGQSLILTNTTSCNMKAFFFFDLFMFYIPQCNQQLRTMK